MNDIDVLLVDDEPGILKACQRLLRRAKLTTETANSPRAALALLEQNKFSVIVSDQRMPEMEGTEFLTLCRDQCPDAIRMLLTGYADINACIAAINDGAIHRYLTKPWDDEKLIADIKSAVELSKVTAEKKRLESIVSQQNAHLSRLNESLESKVQERTSEIQKLSKNLEESLLGAVQVMSKLNDLHSPVLGSHGRRVGELAYEVGRQFELSADELFQLHVAGLLHDIGKFCVPTSVLKKSPGLLTKGEKEALQQHAVQGEQLLKHVKNMPQAPLYVRHHHERMDGRGYPDGLHSQDIPLGARILAVCNRYDHLMNDRLAYRRASASRSLEDLSKQAGTLFDADVILALSNYLEEAGDNSLASELEIGLSELQPGMKLAQDLTTIRGILLLPAGTVVNKSLIAKIRHIHDTDPLQSEIKIVRNVDLANHANSETTAPA